MKFLLPLLLVSYLFGATYDEYRLQKNGATETERDFFMYGNFQEIVRFDPIHFNNNILHDGNGTQYDKIITTIKKYIDDGKDIRITIIGHTNEATDDHNENIVDSRTYANIIQNWFRYSLDTNSSQKYSEEYANSVENAFIDDNISKKITVLEYRRGDDMAYTDETVYGRDLSNRVMVAMYVIAPDVKDSDNDGVIDKIDRCPNTPTVAEVDIYGCPLDDDKDGVANYRDDCLETPFGEAVNDKGCPLDSDDDGVVDPTDECPDTPQGMTVDEVGCPISKELKINFDTNSYNIKENTYDEVLEFAEFLKENSAYSVEIVGHTDSSGNEKLNKILSKQRADAVKKALISEGVDESKIVAIGRGSLDPLEDNDTPQGREINRRIEANLTINN